MRRGAYRVRVAFEPWEVAAKHDVVRGALQTAAVAPNKRRGPPAGALAAAVEWPAG